MKDKKTIELRLKPVKEETIQEESVIRPSMVFPVFEPACNVYETATDYIYVIEMLGSDGEDVSVRKNNNSLLVESQGVMFDIPADAKEIEKEFSPVRFSKWITLPENADSDRMSVKFKNGILYLTVGKKTGVMFN